MIHIAAEIKDKSIMSKSSTPLFFFDIQEKYVEWIYMHVSLLLIIIAASNTVFELPPSLSARSDNIAVDPDPEIGRVRISGISSVSIYCPNSLFDITLLIFSIIPQALISFTEIQSKSRVGNILYRIFKPS